MKARSIFSYAVLAILFASLGWFGHALTNVDQISPGESIAAAWQTQLNVLTNVAGKTREPSDASEIAKISFSSLSIGLALHYDQLSEQQKRDLAPFITRAKSVRSASRDDASLAVLDCIESAGSSKPIDQECIAGAVKRDG